MRYVYILAILLVGVSLPFNHMTASAKTNAEQAIYLKIGKYYILYTKPASPFLDQQGRLLVPISTIRDLLGGTVSYNSQNKSASTTLLNHSFTFTAYSNAATLDGKPIKLDAAPTIYKQAMYLPVRQILDGAKINWTWDSRLKLLHITDDRVVKGKPFEQFAGNDFAQPKTENAYHLKSFTMTGKTLAIRAVNISGKNIPAGKSDIQHLISYGNHGGFAVDSYTRPSNPPLPEVRAGSETVKKVNFEMSNATYIIAVGRELK